MANDASNCTSTTVSKNPTDRNTTTIRDLRREIVGLRGQLNDCELAASRYAVMLREGDHRIKNSLQLVASMMRLQARRLPAGAAHAALLSAAARVGSVAGIHDALQATQGADLVDLGATLRKMCVSLQAMAGDEGFIQVIVDAEQIEIPVALAQPITLAVNELVVNALRHAFPDRERGSVLISLHRTDGGIAVSVADNGIGLPLHYAAGQGYGTALVGMIMKQIGGNLATESNGGARFTIQASLGRR